RPAPPRPPRMAPAHDHGRGPGRVALRDELRSPRDVEVLGPRARPRRFRPLQRDVPTPMMEALPAVVPATSARPRRQVWSVGGGKGGIGKSLITASVGYQLARMGRKVVLVDADLGGANLHTCLGLSGPALTLGDFICRRADR